MNRSWLVAVAAMAVSLPFVLSPTSAGAPTAARPYDFDGNGYPDLAAGAPFLGVGVDDARGGGVVVLKASANGLARTAKVITQASPGVPGVAERDRFGAALASADFDRDGYADLAVGSPWEGIGTIHEAGYVTVIYGSSTGLDTARSVGIGRPGGPAERVGWGESLTAGDFNTDGYPDLAVGAPPESAGDVLASGTVRLLWGGVAGIRETGVAVLTSEGGPVFRRRFGSALAAGDLDGDRDTDLVVGAAGDWFHDGIRQRGSVSYCPAQQGGPTGCRQLVESNDIVGLSSVTLGNMSGGLLPEIAVGVPTNFYIRSHGHVSVVQLNAGSPITVARQIRIAQSSAGVPGSDEVDDSFASSVALADIDRDGYADLAVGAPTDGGGRVTVIHGASAGWRTRGNYTWSQDTAGIPGASEPSDGFGQAVTLLDHNRDGRLDMTIGAPGENDNGAITTLSGSSRGLTTQGSRTFGLTALGYPQFADSEFGSCLGRQ